MRHEARQVPSWLIFDVGQKMKFLAFIVVLVAAGCATAPSQPTHLNQALALSSKELTYQKRLAQAGDGEASYRIATHYSFYARDDAVGQEWLRRSSDLGYPMAQSALGRRLVNEPNDSSKAEGMRLIRKSAQAGDSTSVQFLEHLRYFQTFTSEELRIAERRMPDRVELVQYLARHPEEFPEPPERPNKAPEPTPGAVTPRATEGVSR